MSDFQFVGEPFHREAPEACFGIAVADLGGADSLTFSVYHREGEEDAWVLLRQADIHAGACELTMRAAGIRRILRQEVEASGGSGAGVARFRLTDPAWLPAPEQGGTIDDARGELPSMEEEEAR